MMLMVERQVGYAYVLQVLTITGRPDKTQITHAQPAVTNILKDVKDAPQ